MKTPPHSGSEPITVIRRFPVYEFAIATRLDTGAAWVQLRRDCTVLRGDAASHGAADRDAFFVEVPHQLLPKQLIGLCAQGSIRKAPEGSVVRARVVTSPQRLFSDLTTLLCVTFIVLSGAGAWPRWLMALFGVAFITAMDVVTCIFDGRSMLRFFVSRFAES